MQPLKYPIVCCMKLVTPISSGWVILNKNRTNKITHCTEHLFWGIFWKARWGIWEVARLGDFITRNQFFYYKCYIYWIFKPIFALSYSQILRWLHAGAIISIQVQKKSAWMAWNNVWRFLWSPNVMVAKWYQTVKKAFIQRQEHLSFDVHPK